MLLGPAVIPMVSSPKEKEGGLKQWRHPRPTLCPLASKEKNVAAKGVDYVNKRHCGFLSARSFTSLFLEEVSCHVMSCPTGRSMVQGTDIFGFQWGRMQVLPTAVP